ncbi:MAG: ABC transporter permease [Gemmatimonadaceae bacterium]
MTSLLQDLRHALRSLRTSRGFAAVAVAVLALGIGANTTIFSLVNAVMLRPLPFVDARELYMLYSRQPAQGITRSSVSAPDVEDWRRGVRSFEALAGYLGSTVTMSGGGDAERLRSALVTPDFFKVLRVRPAAGREFAAEEFAPGGPRVALISDGLWRRRFGADPRTVGRVVTLEGELYTIVGVMPPGFDFGRAELWAPFNFPPEVAARGERALGAIARLRAGANVDVARSELDAINRRLAEAYPPSNSGWGAELVSLHADLASEFREGLLLMLGAVAFVLLIACANVANLLLARGAARRREIAVRVALGATRMRLVRQLLTESVVLALAGGALGVLLALWGVRLVGAWVPVEIPSWIRLGVDARVLGFSVALSVLTGLLFGLAPALRASDADVHEALKSGGRSTSGGARGRLRSSLVVAEVALSLVLLAGALLFAKSFVRLRRADPGYDPRGVLSIRLSLPQTRYSTDDRVRAFYAEAVRRARALPGVQVAAAVLTPPLGDNNIYVAFTPEGQPSPQGQAPHAHRETVTPDYFHALGIPMAAGRSLTEADHAGAARVAVVNETFANHYWPAGGAVGKRFHLGQADDTDEPWMTIVGVVRDVKQFGVNEGTVEGLFMPHAQSPSRTMTLVIRATADPAGLAPAVRREIGALDPEVALFNVLTLEQALERSVWQPRLYTALLGIFAAVALVLAAIGLYGVVSYTVARRTHEIGLRMALGAQRRDVVRLVVGEGARLVAIGIAVGLAGALAVLRVLRAVLFGVSTTDPATFATVSVTLAAAALLASYIPARRAARVDPLVAMRSE